MKLLLFICTLISLLLTACSSSTTDSLPASFSLPEPKPETPLTPAFALANFVADSEPSGQPYRLGAGDRISVLVWDQPNLSSEHTIGPDGKITLPLTGTLNLAELTREEAAQTIMAHFSPYYRTALNTTVKVEEYASNRILILGQVKNPGEIRFGMGAPTLLEALAMAGGFVSNKDLAATQSLPLTRCAVFRGRHQVVWIELAPLLAGRDLSMNLPLRRNDIVYVQDVDEQLIYVLGEVNRPGAYPLSLGMSFLEALSRAGGPTERAAEGRIQLIRPSAKMNIKIDLNDIFDPEKPINAALQAEDIIYVPAGLAAKINYALQFLTPISQILSIYSDIESIRADRERRLLMDEAERLDDERKALEDQRDRLEEQLEEQAGFE